jgi:hypothetical protein
MERVMQVSSIGGGVGGRVAVWGEEGSSTSSSSSASGVE